MSLLQNEDFKTEAQITGAGGTASQLLNDTKIWVTGNSINKTLDDAIVDGDIGGGGSGINYITNGDFKTNDTGWVEYADAAGVAPVDGTGGSPLTAFTRSTSSPLRGTGSGFWNKIGSVTRQGEGVAYAFTIDTADQGKMQQISFDYTVTSSYADGDMRVYIYDVTNSVLIEPSQRDILANSGQAKYLGYFQAPSNSTSYRFIIHTSSASAANYDLKIDNVKVGPISSGNAGTFVSDYQDFTLSAITGLASFSTVRAKYRRVGGNAEGYFEFTASVDATTTLVLPLNFISGLTVNSALIGTRTTFGHGFMITPSNSYVFELSGEASGFTFRADVGEFSNLIPSADGGVDSGDRITCQFNVPIQGWSTGVSASEMPSGSVAYTLLTKGSAQSIANATSTKITFTGTQYDYSGIADIANSRIIIGESGIYDINAVAQFASNATGDRRVEIRVGGTLVGPDNYGRTIQAPNASSGSQITNYVTVPLVKGNIVELYAYQGSGGALDVAVAQLMVKKSATPAIIAPTEFVGCHYTHLSQAVITTNTVAFATRIFDSHNAMSSGLYTVPVAGKYRLSYFMLTANVTPAAGNYFSAYMQQTGSATVSRLGGYDIAQSTTNREFCSSGSTVFDCARGDILKVIFEESIPAVNLSASGNLNYICIERIS